MSKVKPLTEKECENLQVRDKNAFGDRWPYKGHFPTQMRGNLPLPELPEGWVYIHIPMWGVHVRREGDTDYMNDLNRR